MSVLFIGLWMKDATIFSTTTNFYQHIYVAINSARSNKTFMSPGLDINIDRNKSFINSVVCCSIHSEYCSISIMKSEQFFLRSCQTYG